MISGTLVLTVVASATRFWARCYTFFMPPPVARRRLEVIDADLWDEIHVCRQRGRPDMSIAGGIASRALRGMGADLLWRHEFGSARTALVSAMVPTTLLGAAIAGFMLFGPGGALQPEPLAGRDLYLRARDLFGLALNEDTEAVSALAKDHSELVEKPVFYAEHHGKLTALQLAAHYNSPTAVQSLLSAGVDPNEPASSEGWTALQLAAVSADPRVAQMLVAAGAEVDLYSAVALGELEVVADYLARNPLLANERGPFGATPLHFARTTESIRLLLSHGAIPDIRDLEHGETPAEWMGKLGTPEAVAAESYLRSLTRS